MGGTDAGRQAGHRAGGSGSGQAVCYAVRLAAGGVPVCGAAGDERELPLLIHAVKATEELFAIKKEMRPRNAWIIHGFRGKKELAESLLGQGFYLSFGEKYQPEALRITPEDRLLLETDEATADIADVYERVARERKRGLEELTAKVQETINRLFFNQ